MGSLKRAYLDVDLLTRGRVGLGIDGGLSVFGGLVGHGGARDKKTIQTVQKLLLRSGCAGCVRGATEGKAGGGGGLGLRGVAEYMV